MSTKTFGIRFIYKSDFEKAIALNNLSDKIDYDELSLIYNNEFFRERFIGYLRIIDLNNFCLF